MPNKVHSVWDATKVDSAKSLHYPNPEKHSKYVVNSPFNQGGLFKYGEHIISRKFKFSELSTKEKYKIPSSALHIDKDEFTLSFYFSKNRLTMSHKSTFLEIQTSLGWAYITEVKPKATLSSK